MNIQIELSAQEVEVITAALYMLRDEGYESSDEERELAHQLAQRLSALRRQDYLLTETGSSAR